MQLTFLGAARQVTGSRYLLTAAGQRIMIDCGMFQERDFLGRNWEMPITEPGDVDVLLLTHAHLDHAGLIPRLVAGGFDGPIMTTEPTVELAELIMLDSARIQEEDAAYKRKRHAREGRRGPHPVEPLYATADARRALPLLRGLPYGQRVELGPGVTVTFHESGHILGSAIIELDVREAERSSRIVFSGDIGQWDRPLIGNPQLLERADVVVMESTYGDRTHRETDGIDDRLAHVVSETAERGGSVVIPTFAIERAQDLLYHLSALLENGRIPRMPVYLDSPMAVDVTGIFRRNRHYLDDATRSRLECGDNPLDFPGLHLARSTDDSRAINSAPDPKIIMSTSGMCTAGRIKHHLRRHIGREDSTILFVGYQAPGTLGRRIVSGEREVRIHGRTHAVRARVDRLEGFSAHGDGDDLVRWIGHFDPAPSRVFLTHGEASAAEALANRLHAELGVRAEVPAYRSRHAL